MKKIFFAAFVLAAINVKAQATGDTYSTGVGVKFYPGAITVKHFTQENKALEGLAYFWDNGTRITGLYEIHGDINGAPGLKWYVGPGAHIGFWSQKWKDAYPDRSSGVAIGVDGVIGLDFKLNAPIDLSLDWQPSFNFVGYNYFEAGWGGLSIRYTF